MRPIVLLLVMLLLTACELNRVTPTPTQLPADTPVPEVTDEPTPEPSATPDRITQCPGAPPLRLTIQGRARVIKIDENDKEPLNLRSGPGLRFDSLEKISPAENFFVLDGPTCGDGYAWYYVRYRETEGWIAEGDDKRYYVEPYLVG